MKSEIYSFFFGFNCQRTGIFAKLQTVPLGDGMMADDIGFAYNHAFQPVTGSVPSTVGWYRLHFRHDLCLNFVAIDGHAGSSRYQSPWPQDDWLKRHSRPYYFGGKWNSDL